MALDAKNYDPALMYGASITTNDDATVTDDLTVTDAASIGGTLTLGGTAITATAAEINQACDESVNTVVLTATKAVSASETGSTFFLNSATEFVSTLPAPALGLRYTFIVKAAPSGASYTVVTTSSANIIVGQQHDAGGAAGDTGSTDDTITFVDGQAVAGDRVDVISDGTSWFAYAYSKVAAGITFTTAS